MLVTISQIFWVNKPDLEILKKYDNGSAKQAYSYRIIYEHVERIFDSCSNSTDIK